MCLRRQIEVVIDEYVILGDRLRLIDHGCGNMPYRPLFEGRVAAYIGCDLCGNELADAEIVDGVLPVGDEDADIVLSSQVLEHVEDPAAYLAESRRVMKIGGLLILSTHGVWKYHPDPTDFWRWTCDGLRREVQSAGFEIVRFTGVMGPEATALQLWQDAVLKRVPRRLRSMFVRYMQWRIQRADERCPDNIRDTDACVYVVVARKVD